MTESREAKMGRLRFWVDDTTEAGLRFIRQSTGFSGTRAVTAAIALMWLALAETKEGRRVVSLNPDGTVNKHIL